MAEFILEGEYFDQPEFTPAAESPEAGTENWDSLALSYEAGRQPIIFTLDGGNTKEDLEQLLFLLEHSRKSKPQQEVLQRIREAAKIVSIKADPEQLTDDAWEMLNGVEALVARKLDGIIYDPDTGFHDKNVKQFYRL
jgi:hypothetical protein